MYKNRTILIGVRNIKLLHFQTEQASELTPRLRTIIFILKLRKQFHKAEWLVQGYAASQWQS